MPNWCRNRLFVFGFEDDKERRAFAEAVKGIEAPEGEEVESLSFERLVPIPHDEVDRREWCKENWGTDRVAMRVTGPTKGGFCSFTMEETETLTYSFDTAWSPPRAWIERVAKKYDKLGFALIYAEPGWDVYGITVCREGEVAEDSHDEGGYLTSWIYNELWRS
jgi:Ferredoxin-like domain in Api92-like protein